MLTGGDAARARGLGRSLALWAGGAGPKPESASWKATHHSSALKLCTMCKRQMKWLLLRRVAELGCSPALVLPSRRSLLGVRRLAVATFPSLPLSPLRSEGCLSFPLSREKANIL